jgi:hypothetical protein
MYPQPPPPALKSVLFYSRFCQHSGEAVRAAASRPNDIALVCVDDPSVRVKVPSCVDRVPTLFTADRRLLVNDALFAFLLGGQQQQQQQHQQYQQQQQPQQHQQRQQPQPQKPNDMVDAAGSSGGIGGAAFSWLEGPGQSGDVGGIGGSLFLPVNGTDDFPRIHTPEDDALRNGKHGDMQQMQQMQQQQQQRTYQPLSVHPPPEIPGRGMVALAGGNGLMGNAANGEPPPRMMPSINDSGGGKGNQSIEAMLAAREQDMERWMVKKPTST